MGEKKFGTFYVKDHMSNDFSFMVLVMVMLFKDGQGTKLLICVSYSCEFV